MQLYENGLIFANPLTFHNQSVILNTVVKLKKFGKLVEKQGRKANGSKPLNGMTASCMILNEILQKMRKESIL